MKFVSLFSGVGGFDLGFERAGMECVAQVEIDAKCREVLAQHWPDVTRHEDVKEVSFERGTVDMVCGGFPCQDLSVAGKRAGLAGERSGLWFEFHRVLAETRPAWVVIENVPGLLSSNGGRDFAIVLRGLVELGYGVCWRILDAQYFGVAQRRRRVFIVGHLGDGRAAEVLFESYSSAWDSAPSREAGEGVARASAPGAGISGAVSSKWAKGTGGPAGDECYNLVSAYTIQSNDGGSHRRKDRPEGGPVTTGKDAVAFRQLRPDCYEESDVAHNLAARDYKDATDLVAYDLAQVTSHLNYSNPRFGDPCHPLTGAANQSVVAYNWQSGGDVRLGFGKPSLHCGQVPAVGVRHLTPSECCRLQGFPDNWNESQSDTTRYRQMGNAVCVPVAEWIGRRIVALE